MEVAMIAIFTGGRTEEAETKNEARDEQRAPKWTSLLPLLFPVLPRDNPLNCKKHRQCVGNPDDPPGDSFIFGSNVKNVRD
jgi:hypothetical protein